MNDKLEIEETQSINHIPFLALTKFILGCNDCTVLHVVPQPLWENTVEARLHTLSMLCCFQFRNGVSSHGLYGSS